MKLREVIEDCKDIKDYLEELVGSNDKIDMGIKFDNLKLTYIMPEIFEKDIDAIAKEFFKRENGRFVVVGEGSNCIEDLKQNLLKFEKKLIEVKSKNK